METNIWNDPVVEEVRTAREALFREEGYDLGRLHDRIMASQERHHERLVKTPEGHVRVLPDSSSTPPNPLQ